MKIHPNYEFDQMLKDGSAKVISFKSLPARYLDISKDTAADHQAGGKKNENSEAGPASGMLPEAGPAAGLSAAWAGIQAADIFQAILPFNPPEPEQQRAAAPDGTPGAGEHPADEQVVPPGPDMPPEAPHQPAVMPGIPPESIQQPAATPGGTPGAGERPADEQVVPPGPDVPPEALHQPAGMPDVPPQQPQPDTEAAEPAETAVPSAVPGITVKIIRPEAEPGGLVAELHFEGDPSGLVFGVSHGYVTATPEIGAVLSAVSKSQEEDPSYPPYLNFTAFNRLGLTVRNLANLLDSDEDFELNIIDCNSKDNSWDYIQSLKDSRIKSRIHFDKNCGPIFAANFGLARRKPYQYYIVMDSDTFIKTKNWIARFMEVFNAFPEVGLLGLMRDNPYPRFLPPIIPRVSGAVSYLELKNADINTEMDFIPGQLQCMRPGLIREIGYWSEENGFGDAELSPRVVHYTNYKAGFITTIEIDMTQRITCEECMGKDFCKLSRSVCDCFEFSKIHNKNESFVEKNTWKFKQSFQELKEGKRTAYCASIHDPESVGSHPYNAEWAYENFNHYILNAN